MENSWADASNDPRKDNNIVLSELLENRPEIVSKTGFEWSKKCVSSNTYVINIKGENCETNSHNEIWFYNNCYIPTKENYEKRFLEAVKIHKECAYMATSWGIGQVIGANFRNEFNSIDEMEKELMNGSSSSQLFIMASFIKNNSTLKNAINDKEWAIATSEYNGPNYSKKNMTKNLKKNMRNLKNSLIITLVFANSLFGQINNLKYTSSKYRYSIAMEIPHNFDNIREMLKVKFEIERIKLEEYQKKKG